MIDIKNILYISTICNKFTNSNKLFIKKLLAVVFIMIEFSIIFLVLLIIMGDYPNTIYIYSILLLLSYPIVIGNIYHNLILEENQIHHIVVLFLLFALFFIYIYAMQVTTYPLIGLSSSSANLTAMKLNSIDSIYWSATTFTTLGYGDFLPATNQGKILSVCLALTGIMHMVTFVSLILQKIAVQKK